MSNIWQIAESLADKDISSGHRESEKIVDYISNKYPNAIGATKQGKDLIMALVDQAMVPANVQDKIEGMLGIGEDLDESTLKESSYSPAVSLAIHALEEKSPDCLGDTKDARELIIALMDQAGFQLAVQNKVSGILGLSKKGDRQSEISPMV